VTTNRLVERRLFTLEGGNTAGAGVAAAGSTTATTAVTSATATTTALKEKINVE
jgi:hypothetical protein